MHRIGKRTKRKRYILFHIRLEKDSEPVTQKAFIQALRNSVTTIFSKTTNDLGLWVVRFDGVLGIVKCSHTKTELVKNLLQSLDKIGGSPVKVTTLATSGTIHGLSRVEEKHATSSDKSKEA